MENNFGYIHEEYKNKLHKLEDLIQSSVDENGESTTDYIMDSVCQIYKALIENEQYFDYKVDKPTFAKKMIRCYRYISSAVLDYKNVDRVVIGGLFAMADVCLIPKSMIDKATHGNTLGDIAEPEKYGLPSHSEVNYGTRKVVNENLVVVFKRGGWADEEITHTSQYDYVTLS